MKLTLLVTLAICRTAYADIDAEKVEPALANLSGEASGATAFVAATLELEASVASGEINLKALETARDHINKTADDIKMMRGQPEIYTRMRTKYLPRLEKAELATAKLIGFHADKAYGDGKRVDPSSLPAAAYRVASDGPDCPQGKAAACATKWVDDLLRAHPKVFLSMTKGSHDGVVTLFKNLMQFRDKQATGEDSYTSPETVIDRPVPGCGEAEVTVQRIDNLAWEVVGTSSTEKASCKLPRTNAPKALLGLLKSEVGEDPGDTFTLAAGPRKSTEMVDGRAHQVTSYVLDWHSKKMKLHVNPCDKNQKVVCLLQSEETPSVSLLREYEQLAFVAQRFEIRAGQKGMHDKCVSLADSATNEADRLGKQLDDPQAAFNREPKGFIFRITGETKTVTQPELVKRAKQLVEKYSSALLSDRCAK